MARLKMSLQDMLRAKRSLTYQKFERKIKDREDIIIPCFHCNEYTILKKRYELSNIDKMHIDHCGKSIAVVDTIKEKIFWSSPFNYDAEVEVEFWDKRLSDG